VLTCVLEVICGRAGQLDAPGERSL